MAVLGMRSGWVVPVTAAEVVERLNDSLPFLVLIRSTRELLGSRAASASFWNVQRTMQSVCQDNKGMKANHLKAGAVAGLSLGSDASMARCSNAMN